VPHQVVDPSLFVSVDRPCLRGSRCRTCSTTVFPAQPTCPKCSAADTVVVDLPTTGVLWSWTVQHIKPKSPFRSSEDSFEPYYIGYVDVGDVIIESRLQLSGAITPEIGMPLKLVLIPAWDDVQTFGFGPA
jgi:uncharacterized protein